MIHTTKNSAFKNHHRDILHNKNLNKNHLYGIILVNLTRITALKTRKHLPVTGYKNLQNLKFHLTHSLTHSFTHSLNRSLTRSLIHSLTTVARLEPKRSSARSPFYATTTNSPEGCAFWGSDECTPCAAFLSFYLSIRLVVFFKH